MAYSRERRHGGSGTSENDEQYCGVVTWPSSSRRIDPDRGCRGGRLVVRGAAAPEDLDDDHAAAAAGTRVRERVCPAVVGGGIVVRLRWPRRYGEQLTGARDVVDARAAGEQAVML